MLVRFRPAGAEYYPKFVEKQRYECPPILPCVRRRACPINGKVGFRKPTSPPSIPNGASSDLRVIWTLGNGAGRRSIIDFSVIIPTYNRLAYLKDCVASVKAQSCSPIEIIVVDDGSDDGSVEWLRDTHPDVRLIEQQNAGPGAARNRGAAEARGEYLAFLDSDDIWPSWALATYREVLAVHERPSLLFARYRDFADRPDFGAADPVTAEVYPHFAASHQVAAFAGAGMMAIRRDAFERTEGFPEDRLNGEDHDLALQLSDARGFVRVTGPVTVAHRVHPGNEMGDASKTARGITRLVEREKAGAYPGGASLAPARRDIISRHARPAVLDAATTGHWGEAATLYGSTLGWHLMQARYKFLAAAGLLLARTMVKRSGGSTR